MKLVTQEDMMDKHCLGTQLIETSSHYSLWLKYQSSNSMCIMCTCQHAQWELSCMVIWYLLHSVSRCSHSEQCLWQEYSWPFCMLRQQLTCLQYILHTQIIWGSGQQWSNTWSYVICQFKWNKGFKDTMKSYGIILRVSTWMKFWTIYHLAFKGK